MKIPNKFNRLGISVNEALPPLTFKALSAGSTIALNGNGNVDLSEIFIRRTNSWYSYSPGTTLTLNEGESVQFWNKKTALSFSSSDYAKFTMTGTINASGNTMSLLNYKSEASYRCFSMLFQNCTALTTAPKLPATTLGTSCYYNMFAGCKFMTQGPSILPATTLESSCYYQMFDNCNRMVNAPVISATTLASSCCYHMFYYCTALQTASALPATTLEKNCYQGMFMNCTALQTAPELPNITSSGNDAMAAMFQYCSKLNNIKVGFTSWSNVKTLSWVYSVSSSGTFYKPSALPQEYGESKIPSGWTVVNID